MCGRTIYPLLLILLVKRSQKALFTYSLLNLCVLIPPLLLEYKVNEKLN